MLISSCQLIPGKLPRPGLKRCASLLVEASASVSVSVNFFLREVLVDNLLPAAVAASCSSQQWEKEPGRRVGRARGAGAGGPRGPRGCSSRRQSHSCVCVRVCVAFQYKSIQKIQNDFPPNSSLKLKCKMMSELNAQWTNSIFDLGVILKTLIDSCP